MPGAAPPAVLGIDPGTTGGGGAVLCVGTGRPRALFAACWTARGERFTVRWATAGSGMLQADVVGVAALGTALGGLAHDAAPGLVLAVVSEAPYVGANAQSALSVARTGAALEATAAVRLDDAHLVRTRTVEPTSWRAVLGISAPDREAAKAKSLEYVPLLVPGLSELLAELGQVDHVTDAAGVATVGLRCEAWVGDVADWKARVSFTTGRRKKPKKRAAKLDVGPKRPGSGGQ